MIRTTGIVSGIFALAAQGAAAQSTLGVPNTGNAPPTGSPVQIEECTTGTDGGLLVSRSNARFKVVFTNEGRVQADLVVFRIDYGDESLQIRDAGKFDPGVTITHRFRNRGGNVISSPLFAPAPFRCSVSAAHFRDGTDWTPAGAAAGAARVANLINGNGFIGVAMEKTSNGIRIRFLTPGGPARTAGIKQGDIIQKIDDQVVATVADAIALISAVQPGTSLKLTVLRDGTVIDLDVIVGARPPSAV